MTSLCIALSKHVEPYFGLHCGQLLSVAAQGLDCARCPINTSREKQQGALWTGLVSGEVQCLDLVEAVPLDAIDADVDRLFNLMRMLTDCSP